MTTNDVYVNVSAKRLIGTDDFGDRLLDYMIKATRDANARNFDTDMTHAAALTLSSPGNDQFDIDGTSLASDGLGHFLDPANATHEDINFENQTGFDYYVGLEYSEEPDDVQINPRTGQPEYIGFKEQIGKQGDPDAVVDNGTNITFTIDSVTESGRTHAGRTAVVYMKTPAAGATTAAVAIETCTVAWSGGANKITTTGLLGQTTVSTTAADYEVIVLGPTVSRGTDLRAVSGVAFIGIITGNGPGSAPTVFDISDQKVVPQSWATALADGLSQDFFPSADATYKLGTASKRWSEIHTADLLVSNSFLPATDDAVDLGSTTGPKRWRDLHLSRNAVIEGTATITKLDVSTTASEGVVSDFLPDGDDTRKLGDTGRRWSDIYAFAYWGAGKITVTIASPSVASAIQGESRGTGSGGFFRGGDGTVTTTAGGAGVSTWGGAANGGDQAGNGVTATGGDSDTTLRCGTGVYSTGGDCSGGGGTVGGAGVRGIGGSPNGYGVAGQGTGGLEGGWFGGGANDANAIYALGGGATGAGINANGADGGTTGSAGAGAVCTGGTASSGNVTGGIGVAGNGGDGFGTDRSGGQGGDFTGGDATGAGQGGKGVIGDGGNSPGSAPGGIGGTFTGGDSVSGLGGYGLTAIGGIGAGSLQGPAIGAVSADDYCIILDATGNTRRAQLRLIGVTGTSLPQNGDIRYHTTNGFEGYHGGSWRAFHA